MRRLVWFTVPFALATAVCVYSSGILPPLLLLCAAAAACLFGLFRCRGYARQLLTAMLGLCAGLVFCLCYTQFVAAPILELSGTTQEIRATVMDTPYETRYGSGADVLLDCGGKSIRALLYLREDASLVQIGDELALEAELKRTDLDKNGETQLYYQSKGILLTANARSEARILRPVRLPLRCLPAAFSNWLKQRLELLLPSDCSGLFQALLTGDKYGMSYAQRSDMTMAGVSHTIAISGMHVSILLGFILFLTKRRRLLSLLIGIPTVLFFVFSTGCSPSVVRAAVMQILFLIAPLLYRENDAPTSLCAALLLILLQNPYAISNVSLQLSFGAMAGILLLTGRLYRRWTSTQRIAPMMKLDRERKKKLQGRSLCVRLRLMGWKLRRFLLRFFFGSLSTTLGALVFTVPLSMLCYGRLSLYSVLSNLLILWAIPVCFIGGLLLSLLSLIWLPGAQLIGALLALPARFVLQTSHLVSGLPFASLPADSLYLIAGLVFAYVLFAVGFVVKWKCLPLAAAVCMAAAIALTWLDAAPHSCKIAALDTGQGQCVCLLTPDFRAVYDCGGSYADEAGQTAAEYLLTAGIRRLDALVVSHFDEDHICGVAQLMYRIRIDRIFVPPDCENSPGAAQLRALAMQYGAQIHTVDTRTVLSFQNGQLCILPPVGSEGGNNCSLSILFSADGLDLLATGDMDAKTEVKLLQTWLLPEVELYVAGHHGSKYSSGEELLDTIRPKAVLICVGRNSYGQPAPETLTRFAEIGAAVYRTDENGTAIIGR